MPDQSSAATEHAILQEITAPLDTLPDDPVAIVNADFPAALRGYDRPAVDAYVERVSQLVAELQATRSPEAAVRRALERVGEQISGILQRAHDTAEQITSQSRREAEDRLEQSRLEAAEITAAAQQRVSDLDAETDRIWAERDRIIEDARDLAGQLTALAQTAAGPSQTLAVSSPPDAPGPYDDDRPDAYADEAPTRSMADPEGRIGQVVAQSEAGPPPEAADQDADATLVFGAPSSTPASDPEAGAPAAADADADADDESPPPAPAPAHPRRSSSVIPPASQAANRRSSR